MGKKDKTDKLAKLSKRRDKLAAIIADKSRPKAERKAAKRERAELDARYDEALHAAVDVTPERVAELVDEAVAASAAELEATDENALDGGPGATSQQVIAAADRVLADANASPGAVESAKAARKRAERAAKLEAAKPKAEPVAEPAESVDDDAIARRVHAKRLLRKAGLVTEGDSGELIVDPAAVPRDRADLVAAYNEVIGTTTGHYLTSDDERAAIAQRVAPKVKTSPPVVETVVTVEAAEPLSDDVAPVEQAPAKPETIAEHEAVEVETEAGTVYAVGPAVSEGDVEATPEQAAQYRALGFASPSDAGPVLEEGRNGYKIAMLNEAGEVDRKRDGTPRTIRQYTRVTTYINNLDDATNLSKWRQRILIEGLVANETAVGTWDEANEDAVVPPHLLALARDAIHVREVAVAKARKADRKGKLVPGELGDLIDAANKACKDALDALAEQALELGGVKTAADKGTNLHALTEVYDEHGIEPIAAMLDAGTITPADFADIEAYGAAMKRAGLKVLERETVVVDDGLKVAGRLDKIVLGKASHDAKRGSRMVADLKTGGVEYAPGKIAQQLALYAGAKRYDLTTHERSELGVSRATALLIHLPAGKATCRIYPVDLVTGRVGNRISGEVRAWRSSSKSKAVDFGVDLAAPSPETDEGGES